MQLLPFPVRVTKTPSFSTVPPSHRKEDLLILPKENTATSKHIKATKQQLHRFTHLRFFLWDMYKSLRMENVQQGKLEKHQGTNKSRCTFEFSGVTKITCPQFYWPHMPKHRAVGARPFTHLQSTSWFILAWKCNIDDTTEVHWVIRGFTGRFHSLSICLSMFMILFL